MNKEDDNTMTKLSLSDISHQEIIKQRNNYLIAKQTDSLNGQQQTNYYDWLGQSCGHMTTKRGAYYRYYSPQYTVNIEKILS